MFGFGAVAFLVLEGRPPFGRSGDPAVRCRAFAIGRTLRAPESLRFRRVVKEAQQLRNCCGGEFAEGRRICRRARSQRYRSEESSASGHQLRLGSSAFRLARSVLVSLSFWISLIQRMGVVPASVLTLY